MSLRICLVTPFAWSQPNDVNDHVRAVARILIDLGHNLTILGPSNRASELTAGRRALRLLEREHQPLEGFVALGPALAVSRYERAGVSVGVRASLRLALETGGFDVVHVYDPVRLSLSYHALNITDAMTVATFCSRDGVGQVAGKKRRERLLTRVDALTATSQRALDAARERLPGDYTLLPLGIDVRDRKAGKKPDRPVVAIEWHPDDRDQVKNILRAMLAIAGWDIRILRTRPLTGRPYIPRALRERCVIVAAREAEHRAQIISEALAYIGAAHGSERARAEASSLGVPVLDGTDVTDLAQRLADCLAEEVPRFGATAARSGQDRSSPSEPPDQSTRALGSQLDALYADLMKRRRPVARAGRSEPLGDRPWILCDLHMHTEFSHDCSVAVPDLLDEAERLGLGAIAITDHNVFEGAQLAVELAASRELTVIPGEEMKTERGEVIGLFIEEKIPPRLSMEETIVAIRDQGGLVYLPHPFDRMHSIARPETIHRLLPEIDVLEVYNARLLFDAYNDEALRFARKYNMLMGAGSDAHVLQGLGTGVVRMRAFEDAEEFLVSLGSAEIVRRPKSLLYLQGLKWVAQARERRTRTVAR